eukprot:c39171_g1_i1 orf=61-363(-)
MNMGYNQIRYTILSQITVVFINVGIVMKLTRSSSRIYGNTDRCTVLEQLWHNLRSFHGKKTGKQQINEYRDFSSCGKTKDFGHHPIEPDTNLHSSMQAHN